MVILFKLFKMYFKSSAFITMFSLHLMMVSCGPLQNYIRCRLENNVSTSEITRLDKFQLPETQEGKCYITCLLKSLGLVNTDGNVDPYKTISLGRKYAVNPDKLLRMETVVLECGDKANDAQDDDDNDECSTSFLFMKCALERRESMPTTKAKRNIPEINITLPPLTFVLAMLSLL